MCGNINISACQFTFMQKRANREKCLILKSLKKVPHWYTNWLKKTPTLFQVGEFTEMYLHCKQQVFNLKYFHEYKFTYPAEPQRWCYSLLHFEVSIKTDLPCTLFFESAPLIWADQSSLLICSFKCSFKSSFERFWVKWTGLLLALLIWVI